VRPSQHAAQALDAEAFAGWRGVDLAFLIYYAGTITLLLVAGSGVPRAAWIASGYAAAFACYWGLKRAARRWPGLRPFYLLAPFVLVLATFESLGLILPHLRAARYDAVLAAWDLRIFGSDPTRWFASSLGPVSGALLQACYTSYYFVPVVLVGLLWRRRRYDTILRYSGIVVSCFFATYIGYYLVPALGPRGFFDYPQPLPLTGAAAGLHALLDSLEKIKLDAFPSGHTAIGVLCLVLLFRQSRRWGLVFAPLVAGLVVSTVALRYHYGVDVLIGLAVGLVWAALPGSA